MITSDLGMSRPELELGYSAMRKIDIKRVLLDHAQAGKIEFEDKGQTKDALIILAEGFVAQGRIPPVRPVKVDPRQKELDELKAQVAALVAAQSAPAAPVAPPPPPVVESHEPIPLRRPGRPKKED